MYISILKQIDLNTVTTRMWHLKENITEKFTTVFISDTMYTWLIS